MKKFYLFIPLFLLVFGCQNSQNEQTAQSSENAIIENIMNRRSIRSYKPEQIKDSELEKILECGINAPSGLNQQSWQVRVIQDTALIADMNRGFVRYAAGLDMQGSASRSQSPGFSVFHGAPTVILVSGNESTYSQVDCGLFAQNVLLSAESMNIGTCVVGSIAEYLATDEGVSSIIPRLNLPEGYKPLFSIVIGYKNESPQAKPRDRSKVQFIR